MHRTILSKNQILIVTLLFVTLTGWMFCQTGAPQYPPLDTKSRSEIIDSVCFALNDVYIFPEVAKQMEKSLRAKLKKGSYNTITALPEFTEQLTIDLQEVSHDKHLRLRPLPPRDTTEVQPSPEQQKEQRLARLRRDNYGFKKVEILPDNIGYLDFRYFADAGFGEAGDVAAAAMNFLGHADAVIFDMRQNGGGEPSMIQFITSYLFDQPEHLNDFYIRKTNETQQFWTQGHVAGKKLLDIPVFVLTSNNTFSGAEEFSYNLKNMKRGTIIGENTGGGAHPVNSVPFDKLHVLLLLPFGRAINPITKTNWEGVGVEPDIKVSADQALSVARAEALKALLAKEKSESNKQLYTIAIKKLEIERNPLTLTEAELRPYTGEYGPRSITYENNTLYYQRAGRSKYKMIPLGDDLFTLDGIDTFTIKFVRDQSGTVNELVGIYSNGAVDSNQRSNR